MMTMKTSWIVLAAPAAAMLLFPPATDASGGSCRPRTLTPAERQAGERAAARLRPLLPPAPPGWKIDGADATDIVSGSCQDGKGKSVPQPVSVQLRRGFTRADPPPDPSAVRVPTPAPAAPAVDAEMPVRVKALEQQIADLKRKEQEAADAYRAARVAGDSAAQRNAIAESRQLRVAMQQPTAELMEIRKAERLKQDEQNEALHASAIAQREASLANRRFAHVSLNTNSGRALSRASKVVSVPGVPLAIAQPGLSMNLLFGSGWMHHGHEAWRAWAPSAPLTRVQDVNVALDGPGEMMQALIRELDLKALEAVIER